MRFLLSCLLLLASGCTVIRTNITTPDGNTINVNGYSFFRQTDAAYEADKLKIHYGAQTEAAKINDLMATLLQLAVAVGKAGAGVPTP